MATPGESTKASNRRLANPLRKTTSLKSGTGKVITDRDKQIASWLEEYLEFYASQNSVTQKALDAIGELSILEDLDSKPFMKELRKEIEALACGKAPGEDNIPPPCHQM